MTDCNCTPHLTINQLRQLLDGYCDTCPHMDEEEYQCEQQCGIPRINADLDKFTEKCIEERMKQMKWSVMSKGAVPTDLAWRFTEDEE